MQSLKLQENLYYVGVVDHSLKVFDAVVPTTEGTSYNSYVLKTEEGAVLFEGSKEGFEEEFFSHVAEIVPLNEIKYMVVAHTEPDHSGAIKDLLAKNPNLTILASQAAIMNLKNITRLPFHSSVITPGKQIKIGQYTLEFVSGLFLHWPDVMFTYIKEMKALVTCDAFGCHYASDQILLSKEERPAVYHAQFHQYFASIMAPFANYAIQAAERVEKLDVSWILTGHGPVVDTHAKEVIAAFKAEGEHYKVTNNPNKVCLVFTTCYGYTRRMAEILRDKFLAEGKEVAFHEVNALNYAEEKEAIYAGIRSSGEILVGSPTVVGEAVPLLYELFAEVPFPWVQGKKASVFGDYGWSGEAVKNLSSFLANKKMNVIEGFRYPFRMDEAGLKGLDEYFERVK